MGGAPGQAIVGSLLNKQANGLIPGHLTVFWGVEFILRWLEAGWRFASLSRFYGVVGGDAIRPRG
jgi:hypothetical protein